MRLFFCSFCCHFVCLLLSMRRVVFVFFAYYYFVLFSSSSVTSQKMLHYFFADTETVCSAYSFHLMKPSCRAEICHWSSPSWSEFKSGLATAFCFCFSLQRKLNSVHYMQKIRTFMGFTSPPYSSACCKLLINACNTTNSIHIVRRFYSLSVCRS